MEERQQNVGAFQEALSRNGSTPGQSDSRDGHGRLRFGVSFSHLDCTGSVTSARFQATVGSYILAAPILFISMFRSRPVRKVQILDDFEGLIRPGEMLLVLGRPGSGCSTFLKALAGETRGFEISEGAEINYQGIPFQRMHKDFKGERVYLAELDVHFAELTLGQTLDFAASTQEQSQHNEKAREIAKRFNLTDAFDTKVGNAMIRGISGGEKRRTSIAEAFIGGAQFQCWDNSTRGLDSLTALRFVKLLRDSTSALQSTVAMSLYQASQEMYDSFDKVTLLYEGRQIYFGPVHSALDYFTSLGFVKPSSATTADFLTSLTSPEERVVRDEYKNRAPRHPEEFANAWKQSEQAKAIRSEILDEKSANSVDDHAYAKQLELRTSTYPLPWTGEVIICIQRAFQRIRNEMGPTIGSVVANAILGLVVGSAFYNLPETTNSLQQRATVIFFSLIVNSFAPAYELTLMWISRPIVEKHHQYAFYHPVADGIASMITEFPAKLGMTICLHLPIYFLANLRQSASAFFVHWLFMLVNLLTMSMLFRMIGALSRTLEQSIPPTSVLSLLCVIYTGFVVPPDYMRPWLAWFWRINPVGYTYESLIINEFRDRLFPCATIVPDGPTYGQVGSNERICSVIGSVPGQQNVQGSTYIDLKYGYANSHLWRNLGILLGMMIPFCVLYLLAIEYIPAQPSRGEVLLFKRYRVPRKARVQDDETGNLTKMSHASQDTNDTIVENESPLGAEHSKATTHRRGANLHWESLNYEIKTRAGPKSILTDINGFVKPGTLTALMGVTGAGKTALLDTLADRISNGSVSGDVYVNGHLRDASFRRRMGYVQQEDIHLHTATVREALQFSALLRQPKTTSKQDKLAYVEYVLDIMGMKSYADAIVGVPGEGLNVEQRKRLTIAVEMAAKPDLVLFLDEPTSGLDSQTAWSICSLLRELADKGQSILCTIHQPSSQLFKMFDRLLLLDKGGTTLYFGDIGKDASAVVDYFENQGAPECQPHENPAEWMLQVTGNMVPNSSLQESSAKDQWSEKWQQSRQKQSVLRELANLQGRLQEPFLPSSEYDSKYAASVLQQIIVVSQRIFTEQWRDPVYTYSKVSLCISLSLINGISFYNTNFDIQGLTSLLFSNFLVTQLFSCINQLIIPRFVSGRQLFEARERHSKSYIWPVFVAANLLVELAWQTVISVPVFASWYYPLGLHRNADSAYGTSERGALSFMLIWLFNLWANTLSQAFGAGIEHAETVVQTATLCFWLSLVFCGVLVPPDAIPRFWIFMYRISPLTYLIEGLAATGLANTRITCSTIETLSIQVPQNSSGLSCGQYLEAYSQAAGGYVVNPNDTSDCRYCPVANTNMVLDSFGMNTHQPWRDVGFMAAYVCFNVLATFGIYWLARVPRKGKKSDQSDKKVSEHSTE